MTTPILRTAITRKIQNLNGDAISGATATIYTVPGSAIATVYTNETGSGTTSQPILTDYSGAIGGWLEVGLYDIAISSTLGSATSRYYSSHPQQSLLQGTAVSDDQLQIKDDNDTDPRFAVDAGGTVEWGAGSGAGDTNLYRSGANELKTDDTFVANAVKVGNDDLALVVKLNKEVFG
jgi:hypothetical protein